jgi:ATP-dependent protease ClpP protease subunit
VESFRKLEIRLLKQKADLIGYEPEIRVHIMSDGGDMFSGLALKNLIEKSRVKVITIAQGACCSAATFMFLGGSERRMGENAYLLIHQLSTEFWGKYQELKDEMKSCDKFMNALKNMYTSKTEIPERKFRKLMKKDLYLSASKCLKYKIAHVID